MRLDGIHHVTAITGDGRGNRAFYAELLGLRLIASIVSPEDPAVDQLMYGSEFGQPGAGLAFLVYKGAIRGRAGRGMVHRIVWRVRCDRAAEFWRDRLRSAGVPVDSDGGAIRFEDFEGLGHELVIDTSGDEPLPARRAGIPVGYALRGFDGVRAYARVSPGTHRLLELSVGGVRQDVDRWEVRGSRRGSWLALDEPPAVSARRTAGTVHHVAWASTEAQQLQSLARLQWGGVSNTGRIEHGSRRSVFFHGPDGLLFQVASGGGWSGAALAGRGPKQRRALVGRVPRRDTRAA